MKRAFILSDSHFGARSNSVEWLEIMLDWFYSDFLVKIKKEYKPGDILIHCGDFFDNRQSINLNVVHESIKLFETLSSIFVDGIYILAGNHDVLRKTSNEISSLDVLKYIPNVNIIKDAKKISDEILLMPWQSSTADEQEILDLNDATYLFCHTNIVNLKFDKHRKIEEGISIENLKKFKRVFTGHIHTGQIKDNVVVVGNSYQMTRSDMNNKKGFYLLDFISNELNFFENKTSPRFVAIYLHQFLEKPISELKKLCKGNRVDLYVESGLLVKCQITPLVDVISDLAIKLDIIPFENTTELGDENQISETNLNILTLCQHYISKLNTYDEHFKTKLITKVRDLYTTIIRQ